MHDGCADRKDLKSISQQLAPLSHYGSHGYGLWRNSHAIAWQNVAG
jgi:hypothetical protein